MAEKSLKPFNSVETNIRQLIVFCSVTNLHFIFPLWFVLLEQDADVFLLT